MPQGFANFPPCLPCAAIKTSTTHHHKLQPSASTSATKPFPTPPSLNLQPETSELLPDVRFPGFGTRNPYTPTFGNLHHEVGGIVVGEALAQVHAGVAEHPPASGLFSLLGLGSLGFRVATLCGRTLVVFRLTHPKADREFWRLGNGLRVLLGNSPRELGFGDA